MRGLLEENSKTPTGVRVVAFMSKTTEVLAPG
jgi:hypothetical protein